MNFIVNARFLSQNLTGVQRYAIEVAKRLKQIFPELIFITPGNIKQSATADELNAVIFGKTTGHLWEQFELVSYLRKHGEPVLLNLTATAPLFYDKSIITLHDIGFLKNPEWYSRRFQLLYKFMIPKLIKKSLTVVTSSLFSKIEITDRINIPASRIRVIAGGVDRNFSYNGQINRSEYQSGNGNYILAVSSLDPRKNLKNLIIAFNLLNMPNLKLLIAGSENRIFSDLDIRSLIKGNRNIKMAGYVSDARLVELYRNARIFIYPSLYEGFGLPPLEAMACGCPVITSLKASIPEVCADAVYYIDPTDTESIANGIAALMADKSLRDSLIEKGITRAAEFTWDKTAAEYARLLKELSVK